MKRYIITVFGLGFGLCELFAQSSDQNYILSIMPTVESSNASTLTTDQSIQTIQYFDGLGRPTQTVRRGFSPGKSDLVSMGI